MKLRNDNLTHTHTHTHTQIIPKHIIIKLMKTSNKGKTIKADNVEHIMIYT